MSKTLIYLSIGLFAVVVITAVASTVYTFASIPNPNELLFYTSAFFLGAIIGVTIKHQNKWSGNFKVRLIAIVAYFLFQTIDSHLFGGTNSFSYTEGLLKFAPYYLGTFALAFTIGIF